MFSKLSSAIRRGTLAAAALSLVQVAATARAGFITFSAGGSAATSSIQSAVEFVPDRAG